jgi:hypothetical protein
VANADVGAEGVGYDKIKIGLGSSSRKRRSYACVTGRKIGNTRGVTALGGRSEPTAA